MQFLKGIRLIVAFLVFSLSLRLGYSFGQSIRQGGNGTQRALLLIFAGLFGESILTMALINNHKNPWLLFLDTWLGSFVALGLSGLEKKLRGDD